MTRSTTLRVILSKRSASKDEDTEDIFVKRDALAIYSIAGYSYFYHVNGQFGKSV